METDTLRQAQEILARSQSVLVLTHQRPDGDALGSMLGMTHMLRAAGKQAHPILAEGMSSVFRYLPGSGDIRAVLPDAYDLTVLVDCADRERISVPESAPAPAIDLVIDHHVTNGRFAKVNLVDPAAASTAEYLADLAGGLGLVLTSDAASCLMAGVVTDTLGFRTANTGMHTLDVAAALIRAGASLPETVERSLHRRSLRRRALLGCRALAPGARGQYCLDEPDTGRPLRRRIPRPRRRRPGEHPFLDRRARVALMFIEQDGGKIKISWRVVAGLDVTPLAISFGGGGHPAAVRRADRRHALEEVRGNCPPPRPKSGWTAFPPQEKSQPDAEEPKARRDIIRPFQISRTGSVSHNGWFYIKGGGIFDTGRIHMPKPGLLVIDKPTGPTSHDIVNIVRRGTQIRKVGHTGTLDPYASGVLLILLGSVTRLAEYLLEVDKEYLATIRFGSATSTYDAAGRITATRPFTFREETPRGETGDIRRRTPAGSAGVFGDKNRRPQSVRHGAAPARRSKWRRAKSTSTSWPSCAGKAPTPWSGCAARAGRTSARSPTTSARRWDRTRTSSPSAGSASGRSPSNGRPRSRN